MDLQLIKICAEKRRIQFKALASSIGMSEGDLHRCVRENKIQAQDLEKIAAALGVPVGYFFDEGAPSASIHTEGDFSPATGDGNLSITEVSTDAVAAERIRSLQQLLDEKDERIADLKAVRPCP